MNLTSEESNNILKILKDRFEKNMDRHNDLIWSDIEVKLKAKPDKLWSLFEMERTGGEPDVVELDKQTGQFIFYDCSTESPKGRRSLCYDREALDARKEHKPKNSAIDMAKSMGIEVLTEEEYRKLQTLGHFDSKTSSWIKTPQKIRDLGGSIFGDFRYNQVFFYHNGAQSYYSGRAFRGVLKV